MRELEECHKLRTKFALNCRCTMCHQVSRDISKIFSFLALLTLAFSVDFLFLFLFRLLHNVLHSSAKRARQHPIAPAIINADVLFTPGRWNQFR